jgi:uncharacterized integral membrane protein
MRVIYFLLLVIFVAAAGLFAWQNQEATTVRFWHWSITCPVSAVIGAVYLVGMLTGWTVVGVLKRTIRRVTTRPAGT